MKVKFPISKCKCGKTPLVVDRIRNGETFYYVWCPECGREGSEKRVENEAIFCWDVENRGGVE